MHLKWFGSCLWMLLIFSQSCKADSCSSEGFYCVSDTEFQLCVDGETVGDPITCGSGLICRNDTENESIPEILCQEKKKCSAEGTFPDEKFINKYFTCVLDSNTLEWIRNEYTCHEDKYFSRETNTCVVKDGSTSVLESENKIINGQEQEYSGSNVGDFCPGIGNFSDPRDCQSFYTCTGPGIGKLMKCPQDTYYNDEISLCSSEVPETCVSANVKPEIPSQTENSRDHDLFSCPGVGYFVDPFNKRRFFICDEENNVVSVYCPESTFFDSASVACVSIKPDTRLDLTTEMSVQTKSDNDKEETYSTTGDMGSPTETSQTEDNYKTSTTAYPNEDDRYSTETSQTEDNYKTSTTAYPSEDDRYSTETSQTEDIYKTSTTAYPSEDDRYSTVSDDINPINTSETENYYGTSTPTNDRVTTTEYPSESDYYSTTVSRTSTTNLPSNHGLNDSNFACPGVGYFPDPKNCQYYYFCPESMDAIPVSCEDGTYFSEETTFCSTEIPERCRGINELSKNDTSITVTTESNSVISTTPSTSKDDHTFTCPSEGYFADPKNCQYYYLCLGNNFFIPLSCPENEFYDEDSTFCTSEKPQRCNSPQLSPESSYQTKTTDNELESATPSTSPEESFVCPGYGYYPNPKNCQGYYACFEFGISIPIMCPEGTYFDERYDFCSSKMPERCIPNEPEDSVEPPETEDERKFVCPRAGIFPDPSNCTKYWFCFDRNFGYFFTCPRGTYYHERSSSCLKEVPETCRRIPDKKFKCTKVGYFADAQNCHTYHVCYSNGIHLSINCPEHTYYDEESNLCSHNIPDRCWSARNRIRRSTITIKDPRTDNTEIRIPNAQKLRRQVRQTVKEVDDSVILDTFVCPAQGLFPDPKNCSKFYSCTDAVRSLNCRPGMYYDDVTEMCGEEFPERCNGTQSEDDDTRMSPTITQASFVCPGRGKFPDPTDCTKYYNCFGPNPRQMSCRPGKYFDEETGMCGEDFPERCNGTQSEDDGTRMSPTTTPAPFVCPGRGKFPDPADCTKYYNCFGPNPRQMSCRPGKYFDEETGMCGEDFPERCNGTQSDDEGTGMAPSTTPAPFVCPGRGKFPDPTDCTKYYNCFGPNPRQMSCRPGKYFDEETGMCGEKFPGRCNGTKSEDDGTRMSPTTTPAPFVCPGRGKFPDPADCTKYYNCFGPNPRQMSCRPGKYFDEETGMCGEEFPERCNGTQSNDDSTGMTPTTTPAPFVCPGRGKFPDPTDCTKYYNCFGPNPRQMSCRPGKYFDEETGMCGEKFPGRCNGTRSEDDGTRMSPTTTRASFVCPGEGLFPDPTDCTKFYNCLDTARQLSCRPGMYYDDVTKLCGKGIPESCNQTQNKDVYDTTPSKEIISDSPDAISCAEEGLFVDPKDCSKYYDCRGIPRLRSCPKRTYFNNKTKLCGSEIPVGCGLDSEINTVMSFISSSTPDQTFKCTKSGRFPDPKDCQKYFFCNRQLQMSHLTCELSMYFNDITNSCEEEMPDRCQPDTSDLLMPAGLSFPPDLICRERGNFANREDRSSYYYCPRENSVSIQLKCPEGQYFDENEDRCKMEKGDSHSDEDSRENSEYSSEESR